MNPNATLIGQMIVFAIFIWFTVKFIWPFITNAIEERQRKIAEGLAAAEKGAKSLDEAKVQMTEILKDARVQANKIVEQAHKREVEMIDEAKATANAEGQRLLSEAKQEVTIEVNRAREQLRKEVAALAVSGASKLLGREIDPKTHADLLDKLALEIERG